MIAIAMILALSGAFIAGLLVFWKTLVNWIKKAVDKIKAVLDIAVHGTRTFLVKTREGLQNKAKYYNENKLSGEWEETVYTKSVSESDVPADILAKVRVTSIDVEVSTTEELKLAISA
jgi:hypothetical protein